MGGIAGDFHFHDHDPHGSDARDARDPHNAPMDSKCCLECSHPKYADLFACALCSGLYCPDHILFAPNVVDVNGLTKPSLRFCVRCHNTDDSLRKGYR